MNQELLTKLQNVIKEMSVNSLGSIGPEQLMECLDASQAELKTFVEELANERLLTYKYRFKCKCGNTCTAYLKKLQRNPYVCFECESEYDMEKVKESASLLYELEKKDILTYDREGEVDFKRESLKNVRIIHLDMSANDESEEIRKMNIFLGSSTEAISDMENIGYHLEQLGNTVLAWNMAGVNIFPPNTSTLDCLIDITKKVDAAVFIFSADDKVWHHNTLKECQKVRDNVLFEYGLFCGALGKTKVCFVCKNSPDLASDLSGITYIDGNSGDITIKRKLKDWIGAM